MDRVVSQLLTEIDDVQSSKSGIFIIGKQAKRTRLHYKVVSNYHYIANFILFRRHLC
jgi:AAA+ superfamily predicted ATPase